MASDIAAKLDEARTLIEKGWCQGSYTRGDCVCAAGAIYKACASNRHTARDIVEPAFAAAIGVRPSEIIHWNDAPERTQAEVIDAFRRAADLARAEQVQA